MSAALHSAGKEAQTGSMTTALLRMDAAGSCWPFCRAWYKLSGQAQWSVLKEAPKQAADRHSANRLWRPQLLATLLCCKATRVH
jgi:hypothetical protein